MCVCVFIYPPIHRAETFQSCQVLVHYQSVTITVIHIHMQTLLHLYTKAKKRIFVSRTPCQNLQNGNNETETCFSPQQVRK